MEWFATVTGTLEQSLHLLTFVVLVLCGVGLPVPEEITYLAAGAILARGGQGGLPGLIAVAVAGVVAGDLLLFGFGRRFGRGLLTIWPFRVLFTPALLVRAGKFFDHHGPKAIFLAGFVTGLRAGVFFVAGVTHVRWRTFLALDLARSLLICPVTVWLGYTYGPAGMAMAHDYRQQLLVVVAAVAAIVIGVPWVRHRAGRPAGAAPK